MRSICKAISTLLMLTTALAPAQQRYNTVTQLNWVPTTGNGSPIGTVACTTSNYGQPYTDLVNQLYYVCGVVSSSPGWVLVSGPVSNIQFTGPWSSTVTYTTSPIAQAVSYLGSWYVSLQNANLNQNPVMATTYWALLFGSSSSTPTGPAGGALNGTYPNPTIATVNSSPGTCGDATHVGQQTINAAGQTTNCTPVNIAAGTSVTLQTNAANNASQTNLNLQGGTNTTASNPSAGNVQVNVPTATNSVLGASRPDTTTITQIAGVYSAATATNSTLGIVRPDNATITQTAGVMSSVPTTSGPTTCTASTSTDICVTLAPYYASGAGQTTTTTTGTTSPSTAVVVGSSSTFTANEGVYIAGAGPSATITAFSVYSGTGTITAASVTSDVATITATNTFSVGQPVTTTGMTNAPWLNTIPGQSVWIITAATGSNFSFAVNHANYATTSDTGTATVDAATLTATNSITAGYVTTVSGLSTATYLNGTWEVLSHTSSAFTFNVTHATASGSDSGTATTNYVGTVATVPDSTHLTVTPATSTSITGGAVVQHDDAAAFQAAIAALNPGSGTVWVPNGVYLMNWPYQDPTGANAILTMPRLTNYGSVLVNVGIRGFQQPPFNGITSPQGWLQTSANITGANLIGGYDADSNGGGFGQDFAPFTNVKTIFEYLWVQLPANPGITGINCTFCLATIAKHLVVNGVGASIPTNTAGAGVRMPAVGNNLENQIDDITSGGVYTPFVVGEHTQTGAIYASNINSCIVYDPGTNFLERAGANFSNSISTDYQWCQNATVGIGAGVQQATVNVQNADLEEVTTYGVNDPNNLLRGIINYDVPYSSTSGPTSFCDVNPNGAQMVELIALNCPPVNQIPQAGMIEAWPSQEGRGSTLVNSGYDFTNAMTTTNVTWTSSPEFRGLVATYNGTTSYSTATAATNTAFDGTLPFSNCEWINPSTVALSDAWIIGNSGASGSTNPGWNLEMWGSGISPGATAGRLNFYLFGTTTADDIQVQEVGGGVAQGTIIIGRPNSVCFTYDGSGIAAGVALYVNGTAVTTSTTTDAFSGSAASTYPVQLGVVHGDAFFPGVIAGVHVWNRKLTPAEIAAFQGAGPWGN